MDHIKYGPGVLKKCPFAFIIPTFILQFTYYFTLFPLPIPPSLLTSPLASSVFILSESRTLDSSILNTIFSSWQPALLRKVHKSSSNLWTLYLLWTWRERERGGEKGEKRKRKKKKRNQCTCKMYTWYRHITINTCNDFWFLAPHTSIHKFILKKYNYITKDNISYFNLEYRESINSSHKSWHAESSYQLHWHQSTAGDPKGVWSIKEWGPNEDFAEEN